MSSTPAACAWRAPGASYEVTMTSGSLPSRTLRARMAGTVCVRMEHVPPCPSSALVAAGGDGEVSGSASVNAMPPSPHSPADSPASPGDQTVCDSCGAPADDVARVHRVYVTPGGWDLAGDDAVEDHVD